MPTPDQQHHRAPQPAHLPHPRHPAPVDDSWEALLRSTIRAPSSHNTQPWRFEVRQGRLLLRADRSRALPHVDPDDRALVISCGAALGHLLVAVRAVGHAGEVTAFPDPRDPDLLAAVRLGHPRTPGPEDLALFAAVDRRHTHRAAFDDRTIPGAVLDELQHGPPLPAGVTVQVLTSPEDRAALAELVAEGDRAQFTDRGFRRELSAWMRPNRSRRPDGIPGHALGIPDLPSVIAPWLVAAVDTGARQARKDEGLTRTAPALLLLSTVDDSPRSWLDAGTALALVLLRATSRGMCASFLNQPVEVPALRPRLQELVPSGQHPQLLLRIGYAHDAQDPARPARRATPRRTVADVLAAPATTTGTSP